MKYRFFVVCLLLVTSIFGCGNENTVVQAGEGASNESALYEVKNTIFRYGETEYNLADINHNINAIMDVTEVGNYLVVEGHTGPKNAVYCIFNTETQEFEKEIVGTNLVWHSDDITTGIYSFWNEIYNYEGELIVTCDIVEPDFIYSI